MSDTDTLSSLLAQVVEDGFVRPVHCAVIDPGGSFMFATVEDDPLAPRFRASDIRPDGFTSPLYVFAVDSEGRMAQMTCSIKGSVSPRLLSRGAELQQVNWTAR
jgi:hypothetical protein